VNGERDGYSEASERKNKLSQIKQDLHSPRLARGFSFQASDAIDEAASPCKLPGLFRNFPFNLRYAPCSRWNREFFFTRAAREIPSRESRNVRFQRDLHLRAKKSFSERRLISFDAKSDTTNSFVSDTSDILIHLKDLRFLFLSSGNDVFGLQRFRKTRGPRDKSATLYASLDPWSDEFNAAPVELPSAYVLHYWHCRRIATKLHERLVTIGKATFARQTENWERKRLKKRENSGKDPVITLEK